MRQEQALKVKWHVHVNDAILQIQFRHSQKT
jgi:hypothetical protein